MKHSHDLLTVVNLIDHAIITNPDPPPRPTDQFLAAAWQWIFPQSQYRFLYPLKGSDRNVG